MAIIVEKIKVVNSYNIKIAETNLNSLLTIKRKERFEATIDSKIDERIKIVTS